jgi:hypothetical protein
MLRKLTKNARGFPEALLYLRMEDGGLGLENWTDRIQLEKIRLLQRLLQTSVRHSISSCLTRAIASTGVPVFEGVQAITHPGRGPARVWWTTSVLEWIQRMGGSIEATGSLPDHTHEAIATLEFGMNNLLPPEVVDPIIRRGLVTRGEYLMDHEGRRDEHGVWAAEDGPIRPHTGMFWMDEAMRQGGEACEVISVDRSVTHLIVWR